MKGINPLNVDALKASIQLTVRLQSSELEEHPEVCSGAFPIMKRALPLLGDSLWD
ncbi:MAG: hypothetical protein BAJALOKI1v1_1050002 [Promethearchaeota archaeon]|nr:MAG: hypothetical protein BAJALOKI1v1_1050002 [Candidatus Lokiarchaeota archaeon]